eukprot:10310698-Ditylum_brightwellii.AAC.1
MKGRHEDNMIERTQSSQERLPSKITALDDENNETTYPPSVKSCENGIEDHSNKSGHHGVHHISLKEKKLLMHHGRLFHLRTNQRLLQCKDNTNLK